MEQIGDELVSLLKQQPQHCFANTLQTKWHSSVELLTLSIVRWLAHWEVMTGKYANTIILDGSLLFQQSYDL